MQKRKENLFIHVRDITWLDATLQMKEGYTHLIQKTKPINLTKEKLDKRNIYKAY